MVQTLIKYARAELTLDFIQVLQIILTPSCVFFDEPLESVIRGVMHLLGL